MDKPICDKPNLPIRGGRMPQAAFALAAIQVMLLTGCAATLVPPDEVIEPTPVYVLDHGRHNSLVLVLAEDRVMRYALGEWHWYADAETGFRRSLAALFLPTESALARIRLSGLPQPDCWVVQIGSEIRDVLSFVAESERVHALADRIDGYFEKPGVSPQYRQSLNLEFVPGPRPYTLFDNSNHQVAAWLRDLGFSVRGSVVFGQLRAPEPHFSLSADSSACSASIHSPSN